MPNPAAKPGSACCARPAWWIDAQQPPVTTPSLIGVLGGHTMLELGVPAQIEAFFQALATPALLWPAQVPPDLITDRLYRRYLRVDQLPAACAAFAALSRQLEQLPAGAAFVPLLKHLDQAAQAAAAFHTEFGIDQPLRLLRADMPAFMLDKKRPLADYDALQGAPFWLR